jgi:hypothetical protein
LGYWNQNIATNINFLQNVSLLLFFRYHKHWI